MTSISLFLTPLAEMRPSLFRLRFIKHVKSDNFGKKAINDDKRCWLFHGRDRRIAYHLNWIVIPSVLCCHIV